MKIQEQSSDASERFLLASLFVRYKHHYLYVIYTSITKFYHITIIIILFIWSLSSVTASSRILSIIFLKIQIQYLPHFYLFYLPVQTADSSALL